MSFVFDKMNMYSLLLKQKIYYELSNGLTNTIGECHKCTVYTRLLAASVDKQQQKF